MNDSPSNNLVESARSVLKKRIAGVGGWPFLLCTAVIFVFTFCSFFPWLNRLPGGDYVDSSWIFALHWAYLHHLDFGHELTYTFGPWGFALHGYLPETFGIAVLVCGLLAGTFSASLLFLGIRSGIGKWKILALAAFLVALVDSVSSDIAPMALSVFLLMASLGAEDGNPRWAEISLAAVLGFFSLTKFPVFVLAAGIIFIISLNMLWKRKIPWIAIAYVISLAVFWVAAGQRLGSFPQFVKHSLEISSGYPQGEGVAAKSGATDLLMFVFCGIGSAASFAWVVFAKRPSQPRPIRRGTLFMWGLFWVLLVTFKDGYIRHDAHAFGAAVLLTATALSGITVFWKQAAILPQRLALAGVLVSCLALTWVSDSQFLNEGLPATVWRSIADFPHEADLASGWLYGSSDSDAEKRTAIRTLTGPHAPIADTKSTVDIYTSNIRAILGAGMNYDPRPIMQSLLAYTPALAEQNAEFLRGPRASEMILFDIDPNDEHFPAEEDSLSWPEILTRYDLLDSARQFVVLKRSLHPRNYSLSDLGGSSAVWGQAVPVPESKDPIWVTIQFEQTIRGRIVQAVLRPPQLRMDVVLADQARKDYRLIPDIARSGFLLSPAILDRKSFAGMFSDDWQQSLGSSLVKTLDIHSSNGSNPAWAYGDHYSIHFFGLSIHD